MVVLKVSSPARGRSRGRGSRGRPQRAPAPAWPRAVCEVGQHLCLPASLPLFLGARLRRGELEVVARDHDAEQQQHLYHITRPLAPPYRLHTVLLKVGSYNDSDHAAEQQQHRPLRDEDQQVERVHADRAWPRGRAEPLSANLHWTCSDTHTVIAVMERVWMSIVT
jgi:hypothetical protein